MRRGNAFQKNSDSVQRILVRSPNWIGDQLLAYPFFHFLRSVYPKAHIAVACVPWVQALQFRNLVDEVFVLPRALDSSWMAKWKAIELGAEVLRKAGKWDLAISLPNSFSAAWLLYRARAKVRRGYNTEGRSFLLNQRVKWQKVKKPGESVWHRSEAYVRLLPELAQNWAGTATEFWGVLPENELDPGKPGVVSQLDFERVWPDAEMLEPLDEPYWVLAPGSNAESRRWPVERFSQLAQVISRETGWTGVIVGGTAESDAAEILMRDSNVKLLDWTGRGTVASYGKVFRQAKFSVCNDSGLAHLAAICGSAVQVIWGAGDLKRTEPIGPGKVQIALNPVECWPCEKNQCDQKPDRRWDCLKGIYADSVWEQIKTGLRPL